MIHATTVTPANVGEVDKLLDYSDLGNVTDLTEELWVEEVLGTDC